jgi:hypothetical protein
MLADYDGLVKEAARSDALTQKRAALLCDKAKLEKDIAGADRTIEAAYTHHLDGLLDCREYELVREKARRDKEDAAARLAFMDDELRKLNTKSAKGNPWREQFSAFRDFDAPTKELVQALISRVVVTPLTNEVGVELNYMDSFAELRDFIEESGVAANA